MTALFVNSMRAPALGALALVALASALREEQARCDAMRRAGVFRAALRLNGRMVAERVARCRTCPKNCSLKLQISADGKVVGSRFKPL